MNSVPVTMYKKPPMEGKVATSLEENIEYPFIFGFQEDSLRKMQQAQNIMGRVPLNHIKSQGSIH